MAKEQIYPYAVARIRVLEKNLLSKQALNQMADDREAEGALRTLSDYGYDTSLAQSPRDFENVLNVELQKTYDTIRDLAPAERFIDVFLYKNDYHNLKVLIKQEVSGIDGERYLVDGGSISVDTLKNALLERNFTSLPLIMGTAIDKAFDAFAKTQSGQMIDITLDKAAFGQMQETAKEINNDFVSKYVAKVCDLTNLKSFLRIRSMGKDFTAFHAVFVQGGDISETMFLAVFGTDNPAASFQATAYGEICEEGMEKGFTYFEKLCDDHIMSFVQSAKFQALTLEPLIAYLYAKESEIKTVRIILTSKINGIDPHIIKERVREAYV